MTPEDAELVRRLRDEDPEYAIRIPHLRAAADAIERLSAENEAAEADADQLDLDGWHYYECPAAQRSSAHCMCGRDAARAAHRARRRGQR